MRDLTPREEELLHKYLTTRVTQMQEASREVAEATNRLSNHNAHVRGEGFRELVEAEIRESRCTYAEASQKVAREHPDLFEDYRQGVTNCGRIPDSGIRNYNRRSI